jgi:ferredoxin-nitrate reductase
MDKLYPGPLVFIHPIDADDRRIRENDVVEMKSPRGMIHVEAKITEDVGPGLVAVDFGWGNPSDRKPNLNALTLDEVWDPISGGYPNRLFLCEIRRSFG